MGISTKRRVNRVFTYHGKCALWPCLFTFLRARHFVWPLYSSLIIVGVLTNHVLTYMRTQLAMKRCLSPSHPDFEKHLQARLLSRNSNTQAPHSVGTPSSAINMTASVGSVDALNSVMNDTRKPQTRPVSRQERAPCSTSKSKDVHASDNGKQRQHEVIDQYLASPLISWWQCCKLKTVWCM